MKQVLCLIEHKKQQFAQLPLFEYLRDCQIDARKRLAFAPCLAFFVLSYEDINQHILREESSNDPIQKVINEHTYEESGHPQWLLEDFEALGWNSSLKLNEFLNFIYSEATIKSRQMVYRLSQLQQVKPIYKLVALEVLEATSHVLFLTTAPVAQELQAITNKESRYFGNCHLAAESDHMVASEEMEQFIGNISLSQAEHQEAVEIVETLFKGFADMTNEFLAYAQTQKLQIAA